MRKIALIVILLAAVNSFAVYFNAGFGVGSASTAIDGDDFDKRCENCSNIGVMLDFRVGGQVSDRFWVAGVFECVGNRYSNSDAFIQFNSYLFGPSVIFYPVDHFHLSAALGMSWTANDTDARGLDLYDGTGFAYSLTVGFDAGEHNGPLVGLKIYGSSVELEHSKKDLSTTAIGLFVAFVHK